MDHSLQLKYQRNYSIIINDCDVSLFYYFDYGERYKQINMEFQHSHRFHEIMIPLSPDAIHFIEGVPYSLEEGDIVLLPPTILHRTEYPAGPPSKRLIISFWYPKDLFGMTDYYLPLLSIFNAQTPIYRFPEEIRRQVLDIIDEIYLFREIQTIWSIPDSGLLFTDVYTVFVCDSAKSGQKSIHKTSHPATLQTQKIYSIAYYIHSHYEEELSLDSLADKFFLSSCYLSHQFKKGHWLYTDKLYSKGTHYSCKDLLLSTNHPISEIAQSCGFQSFSQFNRIFRQTYDQSPSAMRSSSTTITSQQSNVEL